MTHTYSLTQSASTTELKLCNYGNEYSNLEAATQSTRERKDMGKRHGKKKRRAGSPGMIKQTQLLPTVTKRKSPIMSGVRCNHWGTLGKGHMRPFCTIGNFL